MFEVHHYDPRKEDRGTAKKPSSNSKSKQKNPRTNNTNLHSRTESKKRRRKDGNHGTSPEAQEGRNENDSPGTKSHQHNKKALPTAVLQVIAPETDGAISSKKNISNNLTAEAFDDLDLTEDVITGEIIQEDNEEDGDFDEAIKTTAKDNNISRSNDFDPTDEIKRAFFMTTLPIAEAAKRWKLAEFLLQNLQRDGYDHFFPIQALVIPDVIVAERHMGTLQTRDVCCAAPTGSGKTLSFVLPVLNALAHRNVQRLRALVILPSRDLAQQVHAVFQRYSQGSNLTIGLAIGQTDFSAEQKSLILGDDDTAGGFQHPCLPHLRHVMNPGNLEMELDAMADDLYTGGRNSEARKKIPAGGLSAVDILVCTPGRLVDHLDNTPGFTLQHLRFLVIDEADRLLSQSYHGWIHRVLDNVYAPPQSDKGTTSSNIEPVTFRRSEYDDSTSNASSIVQKIQLRKMLFSATLTKDPQKLAALKLTNPKYFNAHHLKRTNSEGGSKNAKESLYRMPERLQENFVECTAEQKPLVLLALLLQRLQERANNNTREKEMIVVFTSSLQSTHRLARLLQLLWQAAGYSDPPMEFSSTLNQHQRSQLMDRCNDPNDHSVTVLVCSDGMSRGMDLASVRVVIHYDLPSMSKTYVHRCGRTARAGQDGQAIALLKGKGQIGQFRRLRRLIADPEQVAKTTVKTSLVRGVIPLYKRCISCLKEVLAAEDRHELKSLDTDLSRWLTSDNGDDEASDTSEGGDTCEESSESSR
ncbi:DEAD/DEAH box helicase domain protein [Nitzschia inconspicua]|uniref:ATP-dependent RNA helicase n=1 Tax=Nitzschia inconspicua TaxID=303405 RepID=A0A9K3PV43_9STRA|nr:DEAD/DEAH box helicase domain protein [Nitzschia inconspicua]